MVRVALAPFARLLIVQSGSDHVPTEGEALTKVYPEGRTSVTFTPVAALGPALEAVIVNVTVLPTFGEVLLTDLVTERFD